MKKSILLATTALISAFALNANAASVTYNGDVTLEATVDLVYTVTSETIQKLDFGRIAYKEGDKVSVTANGDVATGDGYATQLDGTPRQGIVRVTSMASVDPTKLSLNLPSTIDMKYNADWSCGTVTGLTQGSATGGSGYSYDIPFGGMFTVGSVNGNGSAEGPLITCEGEATATLIWTE